MRLRPGFSVSQLWWERGGQGEEPSGDAADEAGERAAAVPFERELIFERAEVRSLGNRNEIAELQTSLVYEYRRTPVVQPLSAEGR